VFHCYVLRSQKTGRRYVGSCESLPRRLHRHNTGQMKATKHGVPWILIHSESFATRGEAVQREFITKPDAVATISIHSCRAVAAVIGRRLKSCRPDFLARESALATSAATTIRVARVSRAGFRVSRKRTLKMTDADPGMKPNKE